MASARPRGAFDPAVAETHSGIVFFLAERAYKLKKPVDLGFLDFRTRAARELACHREVELNRRLSPDVYLGVLDVVGADGTVRDHVVEMLRLPDDRRLSHLVTSGAELGAELDGLAELIARFHQRAERSPEADRTARASALAGRWAANTAELQAFAGRFVDARLVELIDRLAGRYLAGRSLLIDARIAAGRACDGHGDLLADDIFCLADGPRVLDCLEFDDALRLEDGLADVAFLAMDLERLGRRDLGARFLAAYREASGDDWPPSLAHHHIAYRAQVRAKVAAYRADQGVAGSAPKAEALLEICRAHLEQARVRLVLVGGLPGTGKSTLARALGEALGARVLRSDEVRKELAGLDPGAHAPAPFGQGLYAPEASQRTYEALVEQAREDLGLGTSVVLDASWSADAHRALARAVAAATSSDLVELRCAAPAEVTGRRLRDRAAGGSDPSDADEVVAAAMAARADPWPEASTVDTQGSAEQALGAALDVLARAS